jgi:hypothetical protein
MDACDAIAVANASTDAAITCATGRPENLLPAVDARFSMIVSFMLA